MRGRRLWRVWPRAFQRFRRRSIPEGAAVCEHAWRSFGSTEAAGGLASAPEHCASSDGTGSSLIGYRQRFSHDIVIGSNMVLSYTRYNGIA